MSLLDLLRKQPARANSKRVGLVLSGGVMRGAAHLGVLQVFEEEGIRPDLIVGVSAGSVVGGLYCAGISPVELQKIAKSMSWKRLAP